ncbi:endonuclease/exonuclease/phosphatase (EEP) superfamily protein YafD [Diaminobutyricimonas aerilata]|uniref:Endonuclease/exonuclease/phosphatase (EEP) superfamily protein YafD n=1 Tax=Diaminobutyricimonas aerilata TaxID=1162967 RepID=A0A2M9CIB8_9MICO|nr:endonuclease/exonuclease/phosphatase family protein [Diaminobutyricimonas aerilata]PJJ71605.1 endonuclease/exonuclease/phosphatase (EEP) superfamily protein YafD [Diaminobutyricimonas aerilata]
MIARLLAALALLALAAVLFIAAWPQLLGLEQASVVAQIVSLRAVAAGAAVVLLVVFVVIALASRTVRRFAGSVAVLLLAFVLVSAAVLASRGFGPARSADEASLTVLSWNTLGGEPGAQAVAEIALEQGADVVTLPETARSTADEIAAAMLAGGRQMAVLGGGDEELEARATSLLVSVELGEYAVTDQFGDTSVLHSVVALPVSGEGPLLAAVHPVAPVPSRMDEWRADLDWAAELCRQPDAIVAGDFNATLDHLAGLADGGDLAGCHDAARVTNMAGVGTWPAWLPAPLGTPIDHVFATDTWRARAFTVLTDFDDAGSDHRPIVARFDRSE